VSNCTRGPIRTSSPIVIRIAEAERRIAELTAFATHFTAVHQQLGGPAPVAACEPGCGCVPADPPGTVLMELTRPHRTGDNLSGAAR
jgi:hypothetical protein